MSSQTDMTVRAGVIGSRRVSARLRVRGGFTLVELLAVLGIIALVSSILIVALGRGALAGRIAAEQQAAVSMRIACEQFKQQFGFFPPLVAPPVASVTNPNDPLVPSGAVTKLKLIDLKAEARGMPATPDQWYSVYTLAYYLVGVGDKAVDGVDGPGMTAPRPGAGDSVREGEFSRAGKQIDALVDLTKDRNRLFRGDWRPASPVGSSGPTAADWSWAVVHDRWKRPFRYYRWEPAYFDSASAPDKSLVGTVKYTGSGATRTFLYNVPSVVQNTLNKGVVGVDAYTKFPELRGPGFAIVSSGPDGKFSDDAMPADPKLDADNIVEIGR